MVFLVMVALETEACGGWNESWKMVALLSLLLPCQRPCLGGLHGREAGGGEDGGTR